MINQVHSILNILNNTLNKRLRMIKNNNMLNMLPSYLHIINIVCFWGRRKIRRLMVLVVSHRILVYLEIKVILSYIVVHSQGQGQIQQMGNMISMGE